MSGRMTDPRTWTDLLVEACLGVMVGATAIYVAVRLIEAVWSALIVIALVAIVVWSALVIVRNRSRGW